MIYRELKETDVEAIKELHDKYFGDDYNFPDFMRHFLNAFVITDDDGKIILAGGIEAIGEIVLVTDKEGHSMTAIGRALVEAQEISIFTAKRHSIHELVAFTHNYSYSKHLMQHGFRKRSSAFSLKV